MQRTLLTCCLTAGTLLGASPAATAQNTPATPAAAPPPSSPSAVATEKAAPVKTEKADKPAAPGTMNSVTVAGERPTNRIDRQVYEVSSDVGSTNGTAADALNNVPSVAVSPDGSITLRGSSNVQILIDGKPSAMLQGDSRGPALQAMAAEDIESVEVINNPGAQFGNEAGGGPILNLVMRRNRKPGGFATLSANGGTAGRYNSAVSGTYNEGAWGFQGGLNVRHDGRNATGSTQREQLDPSTGQFNRTSQQASTAGLNDSVGANGTVNYNLGTQDTLAASVSFNGRGNNQRANDRYTQFEGASQNPFSDYLRSTRRDGDSRNYSWGTRWDHKGELPNETLKIDLRVSSMDNHNDSQYRNEYFVLPPRGADSRAYQVSDNSNHIIDFTGDYERPLAGGTAKLGYKVASNETTVDTLYTDIDPVTLAEQVNPGRSNNFKLDETVIALYGTYQWRLNQDWGLLGGLRAEYTDMDIRQITSGVAAKNNYINYIPSLFATYKASEVANIRLAYARRLRRPNGNDLNPYLLYRDELNVSSGNPMLKPTRTDSFEIGYETKIAGLETNLRGYYRRDTDAIVDRRYFIADNVLLTTRENGEGSHSSGMELTVSGKITPALTVNANGNLARNQQTVQDVSNALVTRTANSLSGRVRLNYQFTSQTQLQAALQMQGKMLSGTGYRSPNHTLNLSVRHTLTPQLNLVMNVTDLFNTNKMETVIDSATLRETTLRRFDGRVVYLGLSYRFGGAAPASGAQQERSGPAPVGPGGPGGPGRPPMDI